MFIYIYIAFIYAAYILQKKGRKYILAKKKGILKFKVHKLTFQLDDSTYKCYKCLLFCWLVCLANVLFLKKFLHVFLVSNFMWKRHGTGFWLQVNELFYLFHWYIFISTYSINMNIYKHDMTWRIVIGIFQIYVMSVTLHVIHVHMDMFI